LLTVVCRPLSRVMRWNDRPDRPDGSDEEAGGRGITLDAAVSEVGSGVNGNRVTLRKVLAGPPVSGVVVEHRDRLARFGVEQLEAALAVTGRRIIVVNPDGVRDDVVRGHDPRSRASMCARRYGRRSARRRAEAGVRCATAEVVEVVAQ
jgi:putative resolvase